MEEKIIFALDIQTQFVISKKGKRLCIPMYTIDGKNSERIVSELTERGMDWLPKNECFIWDFKPNSEIEKQHIEFWEKLK